MQDKHNKPTQLDMHSDAWWIRALDGDLSVNEQVQWEVHLRVCDECRLQWQAMMAVDMLMEQPITVPQLDASFTVATVQKIEEKQRLKRILRFMAGTLIIGLVTLFVFSMVTSALSSVEQVFGVAFSARHTLVNALVDTLVNLVVSWQAILPIAIGGALIAFALLVPNGILAAVLYTRRRRRAAMEAVQA